MANASGGRPPRTAAATLAGVRVVDLSHLLAGPYCTMLMADEGADVIKVEPPSGDIARHRFPARVAADGARAAAYFLAVNRGKRSVCLDLKTEPGRAALHRHLATADVLVENFRPGVFERLVGPFEEVRERYPSLVVASISAFGRDGVDDELRSRPGVAIIAEAISGVLSHSSEGASWVGGFPLADFAAGLAAYAAIVSALFRRSVSGDGALVDISMTDVMFSLNSVSVAKYAVTGDGAAAVDSFKPVPYGIFPAADGYIVLGVNSDQFWRRLCGVMQRPELAAHPDFATDDSRMANQQTVDRVVAEWTRTHPRDELVKLIGDATIPVGRVNTVVDTAESALLAARGMLVDTADGLGGTVRLPGSPLGLSSAPARVARLGEDEGYGFAGR